MPALMPALLPYLHHLDPASAHLLHHVATAAQQAKQLAAVLHTSSQVQTATFQVLHSLALLVRLIVAGYLAGLSRKCEVFVGVFAAWACWAVLDGCATE
jgi:uncharacterized oligopeptide transporter (OPT) family protein